MRFRNYAYTYNNSHLCFFDIEAAVKPCQSGSIVAKHEAIGYSYIIITRHGEVVKKGSYVGDDPMRKFFTEVSDAWREIKQGMNDFPIHMTREDEHVFQQQTRCQLCSEPFTRKNKACRHHDHSLPQHNYLAAYCTRCNLQCRNSRKFLTTFAHNMNYDVPFLLKEIQVKEVNILGKSSTKYFKVRIGDIQFQDSLNILNSSLASLAQSHIASGYPTPYTREMISYLPRDVIDVLQTQKQFMCYEYIDCLDRLNETSLPPREAFYDKLRQKDISPEDYNHVKHIWNITKCQTLGDYVKMYCEIDVGLLADIYLNYRASLKEVYDLDVSHYVSLPAYAYDAFLKSSKVELDCPYEKDIYYLIKRNVRGGYVTNVRPFMSANNPFTNPNFNEDNMREKYIFYLDFNSLYASAMCGHLPVGNITKLSSQELESFLETGISNHPTDGEVGYWLHIDTKDVCPDVAKRTDDFPLCLQHLNIKDAYLSPYSRDLLRREGRRLPKSNTKLIASHKGLTDHLISLPLLQLLMELGLELQTIHAVYKYNQSQFLKSFIEGNVNRRKQESCTIKSRIFKLMSNAVYGRTLLSETKYAEKHTLVTDGMSFMNHVASPSFRGLHHLGKDRVVCINSKKHVRITQPNYLGFQILELAKISMYFFWYNVVKKNYGERAQLGYEDTDSFIFSLELDQNLHDELKCGPMSPYLDFSNFPPDHPLYDNSKKGKLGLLKSETEGKIIKECVILKPKLYSIDVMESDRIARCKGIPVCHHQNLSHHEFKETLTSLSQKTATVHNIRNVKGHISTCCSTKKCLSSFDDKRYFVDAFTTRAYFHPENPPVEEEEVEEEEEEGDVEEILVEEERDEESETEETEGSEIEDGDRSHAGTVPHLWKKRSTLITQYFPLNERRVSEEERPMREEEEENDEEEEEDRPNVRAGDVVPLSRAVVVEEEEEEEESVSREVHLTPAIRTVKRRLSFDMPPNKKC